MRVSRRQLLVAAGAAAMLPLRPLHAQAVPAVHGIAMHGDLKYPAGFTHFDYADPAALRGGRLALAAIGTFDSLNPYVLKGNPATGIGLLTDTLTAQSQDEAFTEYGLLAETIEMPEDRSSVAFTLRAAARWHDGRPVTVEDVIFSLDILRAKGRPFYRAYYANVAEARAEGERRVRFSFDGEVNRELPLIIGQLPILPKHYWESRSFEESTLDSPLGSGPYRVKSFETGRSIVYERVADYWGADVPVNVGRNNYDEVSYEYYRDPNIALEALKAGRFDLRIENSSRFWATGYTGPAVESGLIVKEELPQEGGGGMQSYAFNIRRPIFKDPRVRAALGYAFDFEWTNKTLFYGLYQRTESYFANTELASEGLPSAAELALLEPYRDRLPPAVFAAAWQAPATDGSGNNRDSLRKAVALLEAAGWEIEGGKLVDASTGEPMAFEIMLDQGGLFERITGPFVKTLERLGVAATIRTIDDAQYQRRLDEFDFDLVVASWGQSLSPGNEQRDYWGSAAAHTSGSRNLVGIEDPIVDELIERIVRAPNREALVAACRALDRVLLAGFYVIPQWFSGVTRIAYWDRLGRPATLPRYGLDLFAWWVDPAKQAALAERARALGIGIAVAD